MPKFKKGNFRNICSKSEKDMNQRGGIKKSFCGCEKSQLMSPQCGRTDIWRTPHWARVASPYKLQANARTLHHCLPRWYRLGRGFGRLRINRSVSKPCGTPALDGTAHLYLQLGPPEIPVPLICFPRLLLLIILKQMQLMLYIWHLKEEA